MNLVSKIKIASSPERLVRPAVAGGFLAADNDMSSVWLRAPNANRFIPLVQAGWPPKLAPLPGAIRVPNCSRVYLASVVVLPGGDALVGMKLGVKEVEASGTPFNQCNWGLFVARVNPAGVVQWSQRYAIHKGNGQIVLDPKGKAILVASTGIAWELDADSGAVLQKFKVVMGPSGEKCFSTSGPAGIQTAYVGYTGNPCGVARIGVDDRSIYWASKPPYNDMGSDMIYCRCQSPWGQPKGVWTAVVLGGQLCYNRVGPRMKSAKWGQSNLPSAGPAKYEPRHAPALFRLIGMKKPKAVGAAYVDPQGTVVAQILSQPSTRVAIDQGGYPIATELKWKQASVFYFKGNELWEAVVSF